MKSDSDEIIKFLDNLAEQSWLGAARSQWAKYIFHYTDIRNAVKILERGKLVCRAELEKEKAMPVDNASPQIISNTESDVKNYVRLYFRPRTPTQYRNEGVRPNAQQWGEAHCPVPVFFLFDSKAVLTRDDCRFSDGNLAAVGIQGLRSTAQELSSFNFKHIYHDSPHRSQTITLRKNAEVVFLNELDLSALKYIICRSPAEKESLLNLLPGKVFHKWTNKILIDTKSNFFFRKWSYAQTSVLSKNQAILDFSPDSIEPMPFLLTAKLKSDKEKRFTKKDFSANQKIIFRFDETVLLYEIEVKLDSNLIYFGRFDGSEDIPF